jgi:hypothetical protein
VCHCANYGILTICMCKTELLLPIFILYILTSQLGGGKHFFFFFPVRVCVGIGLFVISFIVSCVTGLKKLANVFIWTMFKACIITLECVYALIHELGI